MSAFAATSVLFVSHGAPTLVADDCPARRFLEDLGRRFPPVGGIVCVSAHWETETVAASTAPRPATIHDFSGFPEALYRIRYPAAGAPEWAADCARALSTESGLGAARTDAARGLDHGAWVPLSLLRPAADLPVFQVSILAGRDARAHVALGRVLGGFCRKRALLLLASGGATHNLAAFFQARFALDAPAHPRARAFADWLAEGAEAGDLDGLLGWSAHPDGAWNHPSFDHLAPFFVALGAAPEGNLRRAHRSFAYGVLAMDAYLA
jgi:4,5-DOPA dioxygenase extradiol